MRNKLRIFLPASVLLGLIILGGLLYFRLRPQAVPERQYPDGLCQTAVSARFLPEEGAFAVTQEMRFANRSGDDWPQLMLQLPANAYAEEALSPAASAGLYAACYPEGFSPGAMAIDWAEVNGTRTEPVYPSEDRLFCFLPVPLSYGETCTVKLRYRLLLPTCLHRFGMDDTAIRLCRVFPAPGVYENGQWRQDEPVCVGDGWNAAPARFTFRMELPEGYTLAAGCAVTREGTVFSGTVPAADDLCLTVFRAPVHVLSRTAGGTRVTIMSADDALPHQTADLLIPYLHALAGLYGPSPAEQITVCLLPSYRAFEGYPGLILLGDEQFPAFQSSLPDAAYCAARQWFGAGFSTDGFLESWLSGALSEWAGLQALLRVNGRDAYEHRVNAFVDEAMRENLHLSLTPGSPLTRFPDDDMLETVLRGRGCAFLIAADTLSGGRMNEFLPVFLNSHAYQRVSADRFLRELNDYFSMDFSPLLVDYIHTYY